MLLLTLAPSSSLCHCGTDLGRRREGGTAWCTTHEWPPPPHHRCDVCAHSNAAAAATAAAAPLHLSHFCCPFLSALLSLLVKVQEAPRRFGARFPDRLSWRLIWCRCGFRRVIHPPSRKKFHLARPLLPLQCKSALPPARSPSHCVGRPTYLELMSVGPFVRPSVPPPDADAVYEGEGSGEWDSGTAFYLAR